MINLFGKEYSKNESFISICHKKTNVIPEEIYELKKLNALWLNCDFFPKGVEKLCKLDKLRLMYGEMEELPAEFENLINLECLWLNSQKFKIFPLQICSLNKLTHLNLSNNKLIVLPDEIKNLINLKEINLEHNYLTNLPNTMDNLTELNTMYLSNNKFTRIPKIIEDMNFLSEIDLSINQITKISSKLPIMCEINLSDNRLTTLPEKILYDNNYCINVFSNKITSLSKPYSKSKINKFLQIDHSSYDMQNLNSTQNFLIYCQIEEINEALDNLPTNIQTIWIGGKEEEYENMDTLKLPFGCKIKYYDHIPH